MTWTVAKYGGKRRIVLLQARDGGARGGVLSIRSADPVGVDLSDDEPVLLELPLEHREIEALQPVVDRADPIAFDD